MHVNAYTTRLIEGIHIAESSPNYIFRLIALIRLSILRWYASASRYDSCPLPKDFDWDVECNDSVEVLLVRGGREPIAILSHCVPFIFLLAYASGVGRKLKTHFGGLVIDFIDLQDFFLLLLEDDLILGYFECEVMGA